MSAAEGVAEIGGRRDSAEKDECRGDARGDPALCWKGELAMEEMEPNARCLLVGVPEPPPGGLVP